MATHAASIERTTDVGLSVGLKEPVMPQITELKARNIKPGDKPIAHSAVPGLRLEAGKAKGHGKWTLRFVSPETSRRRDMGLGAYPETGIAVARDKALAACQEIEAGKDPIEERKKQASARKANAAAVTFEQAARQAHEELRPGWRNSKHADQWINTLQQYAFPTLGSCKVADLKAADFADVLRPIWLSKTETATRVCLTSTPVGHICRIA